MKRTLVWLPLLALAGCIVSTPHHTPPPQPQKLRLDVGVYDNGPGARDEIEGAGVEVTNGPNKGIRGTTGDHGNVILTGLLPGSFQVCASQASYVTACKDVTLTVDSNTQILLAPKAPPIAAAPQLKSAGRVFTANGQPYRIKSASSFKLAELWRRGEDIAPLLAKWRSKGFNTLRVWCYTDGPNWTANGWPNPPTVSETRAFLEYTKAQGFNVELTLLTDDNPARIPWAIAYVQGLAQAPKPTNLLVEVGNEPETNKKHIQTEKLQPALEASGFEWTSGNYEDSTKVRGTYVVTHTRRDPPEWMRRSHDCLEFYNGGGPNKPSDPAHRMPCLLDEPAKWQDVARDIASSDANKAKAALAQAVEDFKAYFGGGSLMAAGGCFHSETGKFSQMPTAIEEQLADAAIEAMNAFPDGAPLGTYSRPVEQSLRTYTIGPYMVRVRPTSSNPGPGWTRIGASNVLWRR